MTVALNLLKQTWEIAGVANKILEELEDAERDTDVDSIRIYFLRFYLGCLEKDDTIHKTGFRRFQERAQKWLT